MCFFTTNHRRRLDPALTRPGRMDRDFELGTAGPPEMASIFRYFFRNDPYYTCSPPTPVDGFGGGSGGGCEDGHEPPGLDESKGTGRRRCKFVFFFWDVILLSSNPIVVLPPPLPGVNADAAAFARALSATSRASGVEFTMAEIQAYLTTLARQPDCPLLALKGISEYFGCRKGERRT